MTDRIGLRETENENVSGGCSETTVNHLCEIRHTSAWEGRIGRGEARFVSRITYRAECSCGWVDPNWRGSMTEARGWARIHQRQPDSTPSGAIATTGDTP